MKSFSGSLLVLLNRIYLIHSVINEAILSANNKDEPNGDEDEELVLPTAQLQGLLVSSMSIVSMSIFLQNTLNFQSSNHEVLLNICDQMHERIAKLLTQRSKPGSDYKIIPQELTSIGLIVAIFSDETLKKSGKHCTGLQLSLQSQTVLYVQAFHDENRLLINSVLEKETWKRSQNDLSSVRAKLTAIPAIKQLFTNVEKHGKNLKLR